MQKNKILAVYPDLCDHGYISDAFMDSANEVVCVTSIIGAIKCLVEYTFIMVLVDSKMVANGNSSITTTLKTVTDVPILIRTGHCNLMTKERWQKVKLFCSQKKTLDTFREKNAISQAQYDKSLGDLRNLMEMHGVE